MQQAQGVVVDNEEISSVCHAATAFWLINPVRTSLALRGLDSQHDN